MIRRLRDCNLSVSWSPSLFLKRLKLLKRILAIVAVPDHAAEGGAEAVFERGVGGAAAGADGRVKKGDRRHITTCAIARWGG